MQTVYFDQRVGTGTYPSYEFVVLYMVTWQIVNPGVSSLTFGDASATI